MPAGRQTQKHARSRRRIARAVICPRSRCREAITCSPTIGFGSRIAEKHNNCYVEKVGLRRPFPKQTSSTKSVYLNIGCAIIALPKPHPRTPHRFPRAARLLRDGRPMPIGRPVETILGVSSLFPQDESSRTNFEGIPPDVGRTGGIVGMGSIRAVSDLAVGFALPRSPPAPLTMPGPMALACNCPRPRGDR